MLSVRRVAPLGIVRVGKAECSSGPDVGPPDSQVARGARLSRSSAPARLTTALWRYGWHDTRDAGASAPCRHPRTGAAGHARRGASRARRAASRPPRHVRRPEQAQPALLLRRAGAARRGRRPARGARGVRAHIECSARRAQRLPDGARLGRARRPARRRRPRSTGSRYPASSGAGATMRDLRSASFGRAAVPGRLTVPGPDAGTPRAGGPRPRRAPRRAARRR